MSTVEILTERVTLRPFRADDLEAFVAYRSDPEVARYQSWDSTYSMADAESFLSSQRGLVFGQPGEWLQLAIVDRATGAVCGDCAVRVAPDQPATAEIGVTLARGSQGKGLATEALSAVVTELFEQHGMHRVVAEADDRNVSVLRLLERLGFRCEARLVDADWFKGEWSTLRLYAMLEREWHPGPVDRRRCGVAEAQFVPSGFVVPLALATDQFMLEPLGPQHNDSDYDAWSSSREHIHATPGWETSNWPDDRSLEDNLRDLQRHADDFENRAGFTYTVLEPATGDVIGCVYIYPDKSEADDARVQSWVRASRAELDVPLWRAVSDWLAGEWPFERVAYAARG